MVKHVLNRDIKLQYEAKSQLEVGATVVRPYSWCMTERRLACRGTKWGSSEANVRDSGVRVPVDASLQYPHDSAS